MVADEVAHLSNTNGILHGALHVRAWLQQEGQRDEYCLVHLVHRRLSLLPRSRIAMQRMM
jgi:hypothetical protein